MKHLQDKQQSIEENILLKQDLKNYETKLRDEILEKAEVEEKLKKVF